MSGSRTQRATPGRIIALVITALPPALLMLKGILVLIAGGIPNVGFLLCHIVIPVIVGLLLWKIIFSGDALWEKIICVMGVFFVAIPVFLFSVLAGEFKDLNVYRGDRLPSAYEEIAEGNAFLPPLSEIGEPAETEFFSYTFHAAIFISDADALVCRYTPEDYASQKDLIRERYTFQTEPHVYREFICQPQADIDGYLFRMIDSPEVDYPQRLGFIATNDETCEIVWIAFTDSDLDYIDDLSAFILEYCGWEHMR